MIRRAIYIAFALWAFWSGRSHAADFSTERNSDGTLTVIMSGSIRESDPERLTRIADRAAENDTSIRTLRLNSPGGFVDPAYDIAEFVQRRHISTEVAAHDECASACFMIFASGKHRRATSSSNIGVHSAAVRGIETPSTTNTTIFMARYVTDLGVPAKIVGRMVITGPGGMAWLTTDELISMGVQIEEAPKPVVYRDAEPTKSVVYREPAPAPKVETKAVPKPKKAVKLAKADPPAPAKIDTPAHKPVEAPAGAKLSTASNEPLSPLPPFPWTVAGMVALCATIAVWKV